MADPRAFISFDFDHNKDERVLFVGQSKNPKTYFTIEDWSSKSSLPQYKWEAEIKNKINKCNMVIVLVGRSMSTATGVVKEIQFAKDQDVPVFGVYVDGANTSSTLPKGLKRSRTISWKWDNISNAVDQMMNEGKNK